MSIDLNINNVNKGKSYNNFNSNKEYYCHICIVKGHSTDFCKFNSLNKENNNYKNNSFKNKNNYKNYNNIKFNLKRNNNNYHSSNINEDNFNDDISDNSYEYDDENDFKDETYINFTGSISVIENCNNTNFKKENKYTHWIIDSGTGINLTNELNNLKNKNDINNKNIIYPNGKLDRIKCKGTQIQK